MGFLDHNDIAFIFYTTFSFWAWMKYQETKNNKWLLLIGFASGGAILCKWLVGLLVYAGWAFVIFIRNKFHWQEWLNLFKAFSISCLIALPWQIYCWIQFPNEFRFEMAYNALHVSRVVENHSGDFFFYFDKMKNIFGSGLMIRILLLIGFVISVYNGFKFKKPIVLFCTFCFVLVYLFFSVSSTKLEGYVLIVASFGFIFILVPFSYLSVFLNRFKYHYVLNHSIVQLSALIIILVLQFSPKGVIDRHNFKAPENKNIWISELKIVERIIRQNPKIDRFMILNATIYNAPALEFNFGKQFFPYCKMDKSDAFVIDFSKLK